MKRKPLIFILIFVLALAGATRLLREGLANGTDLHVYWRAASAWFDGISPYLFSPADQGRVFKYPPWTLPIFAPLAAMSFDFARGVWALLELFCIGYAFRWLLRAEVSFASAITTAFSFWWIWLGHFYTGQFTLLILCCALWAVPPEGRLKPTRVAFLSLALAAKVFSVFSLLGVWRIFRKPRTLALSATLALGLDFLVWLVLRAHGSATGFIELHQQFIIAATSGAAELGGQVIRGQGNHSFTAAILRAFRIDALNAHADVWVAIAVSGLFSALWWKGSRGLERAEVWAGWLAVGMVGHPLLWHHSFVLAFPLCALALDRAVRARETKLIAGAALSTFLIALFIPNIFGLDLVTPIELLASKSWSLVLACAVLIVAARRRNYLQTP